MANFVGLLDPDPERRALFAALARDRIAFLPGLSTGACFHGDALLVWAAGARAPVSQHRDAEGFAVAFGDLIPGPGPERLNAEDLHAAWAGDAATVPAFDGYHAAVSYRSSTGLRVGVDLLGMFPLYVWHADGITLFGSSEALFACHPAYRLRFDPVGFAGILTMHGLVGNRSLARNVQRVPAGRVLAVPPGGVPAFLAQYEVPDSERFHDASFDAQMEALDAMMSAVVTRHVAPGERVGLMLSGGMDSRTLAGYLKAHDVPVVAYTMGLRGDIEARCARGVARALGFPHVICSDEPQDPVQSARIAAKWEHLAPGFFGGLGWDMPAQLGDLPPRVVTGYAMDVFIGPKMQGATAGLTADAALRSSIDRSGKWGLPRDAVAGLVGGADTFEEMLGRLRAEFVARSPRPARMRWKHIIANRARYHLGGFLWRMSFGAWPVIPVLDRGLIETIAGLPVATTSGRRAERELLVGKFPSLAALPLDRNSFNTLPLAPRTRYLVRHALQRRAEEILARFRAPRAPKERRYYYRIADFNRPAWRAVRAAAEPGRVPASRLVDRAALDRILPLPEATVEVGDGITEVSGYKLLTGFLLWVLDRDPAE